VNAGPELVLLTSAYPFGNEAETFLETEIDVLADRFQKVYVLPSHRDAGERPMPNGVELVEMDWLDEPTREARRLALASREAGTVLLRALRPGGDAQPCLRSPRSARVCLDNLSRNILKFRALRRFVRDRELGDAVFYDYWFENSTLALALLRELGAIRTAVSRAHRFDLYDECWEMRRVPFRETKARALDAIFTVSEEGAAYLGARIPGQREKIGVQRLGVSDPGRACPSRTSALPLVVTCARLEGQKCVHLVPEVLARLRRPVRWLHLGDGPERARVIEAASRHLGQRDGETSWELLGQVDNREVLDFYANRHVDVFLSLSESEGLPVSMMEAQSFGIPIVARGVGGVPEIVTETTGVLLSPDAKAPEAAEGLRAALESGRFECDSVRAAFRRRFDASVNYNRFVDSLLALHAGLQ